jgi:hypothetical protein
MADKIETYVRDQVTKLSNSLEHLQRLQQISTGCSHVEDLQDLWMLREHFMDSAAIEWEQLSSVLLKEVLPLVADIKSLRAG